MDRRLRNGEAGGARPLSYSLLVVILFSAESPVQIVLARSFAAALVGFVLMWERADVPDQRERIAAIKPVTAPRTFEYIVPLLIEAV